MNNKQIKMLEKDGQVYLEFGFDDSDELLFLECELVTKEDNSNV